MANEILAAILSFLIPGLGQFYAGDLNKGVVMLIIFIVLLIVVSLIFRDWVRTIIVLLYRLYVAYDAYQMANYY